MSTPMKPILPLRKKIKTIQSNRSDDLVRPPSLLPPPPPQIQSSIFVKGAPPSPPFIPKYEKDQIRTFRPIKEEYDGPFSVSVHNQSNFDQDGMSMNASVDQFVNRSYENKLNQTVPNTHIPQSLQQMNEFDRFIHHEDFVKFVEMAYKVKVMRHAFASGNPNVEPNLDISNLCKNQKSKKTCHGCGFADTASFIKKNVLSNNVHDDIIAERPILRGLYPRTDGLLNEAIDSLVQEFEKCKLYHSAMKKQKSRTPETQSSLYWTHGGHSEENKSPERRVRSPRKKKKKGDSTKEAIAVKYSKHQTDILTEWMIQHKSHPFPNSAQIKALCEATHLSYSQVVNWTTNVRKRNLKASVEGGKKPHHFLDFLFLADHRDKELLEKKNIDTLKLTSKGTSKTYFDTNMTATKLPKKKEMRTPTNTVGSDYKSSNNKNHNVEYIQSGSRPPFIGNDTKNSNSKNSHSSRYTQWSHENPPQSYYPPYPINGHRNCFSHHTNGDAFHPSCTTYYSPNQYQPTYGQYRFGSQEVVNNPYGHENKDQHRQFHSVSPSFDEQYNGNKGEVFCTEKSNNIVSPEYCKSKLVQDTSLRGNVDQNSKSRFGQEGLTQVEPIHYLTYDPLHPDDYLSKKIIDENSTDLRSKLMKLCHNLEEDKHNDINDNQWNESHVLHRFTKDGILSTPSHSDDEFWDESSLQDLTIESEGTDFFYSNKFYDQDDDVSPKNSFLSYLGQEERKQNHDRKRRNTSKVIKKEEQMTRSNSFSLDNAAVCEGMNEWFEHELNEHIESTDNFLDFLDSIPTAHAEV